MPDNFIMIPMLAASLAVHPTTVRRWIRSGRIPSPQLHPVTGVRVFNAKKATLIKQEYMQRVAERGSRGPGINCEFQGKTNGHHRKFTLAARYEIDLSAMSDDYTPDEISAEELLKRWAGNALESHPTGIIPILWYVRGDGIFESLPGVIQLSKADFLTHFTHPIRVDTGVTCPPVRYHSLC